jgi:mono/diheme cytochrome c family protein
MMDAFNILFIRISLLSFAVFAVTSCGDTTYMQGKRLYAANCQNCHMEDGSGLGGLIPALSSSAQIGTANFACIIKNGLNDTIFQDSTYLLKQMPAFKKFSATEITNIVNYVNHTWATNFTESTILDVEKVIKGCP